MSEFDVILGMDWLTAYRVARFSKAFSRRALMHASGRGAEKMPRGVRKKTKHMIGVRFFS